MARRYEVNQENGGNIPMFQNPITDVSLLCGSWHARRDNTESKRKTIGRKKRERKRRGKKRQRGEKEERAL